MLCRCIKMFHNISENLRYSPLSHPQLRFVRKLGRAYRSRDGAGATGAKFAVFRMFSFQRDELGEGRIASCIPCPSRKRGEHMAGVSFPISRRKIGSFASLTARRVISLFASLRNSFTESSNWGESRIPFQRISNYRGVVLCAGARALLNLFYAVNF